MTCVLTLFILIFRLNYTKIVRMNTAFGSRTAECVSHVELRIECHDLMNKDVGSKSDPCAAMYAYQRGNWKEVNSYQYQYQGVSSG